MTEIYRSTQAVVDKAITRGKGHRTELRRSIAFLGVPVAMDVTMDILSLENFFWGCVSVHTMYCDETAVSYDHPDMHAIYCWSHDHFHGHGVAVQSQRVAEDISPILCDRIWLLLFL